MLVAAELVRYEGACPSFTETVADFATLIHPLVGLSRLVSKVMATRVEAKRLSVAAARDRNVHKQRMAQIQAQVRATDQHSERMYRAKVEEIRANERGELRNAQLSLRQLELNFDAAMQAIKVEGATRRHEIDRHYAAEIHHVDADLQIQMAKIAEERRRSNQEFAHAQRRLRAAEAAQRDIQKALRESTRLMRTASPFTEIAAVTARSLSQSLAMMHVYNQDAVAAILSSMARS
jgi:hypothetical protein